MAAYSLRSAGPFLYGSGSVALTGANLPTRVAGDLLLAMLYERNADTAPLPSVTGWTPLFVDNTANYQWGLWGRIATNDTSDEYSINPTGSSMVAAAAAFSGDVYTDLDTILLASNFASGTSTQDNYISSMELTSATHGFDEDDCLVIACAGAAKTTSQDGATLSSDPSTMSNIAFINSGVGSGVIGVWSYVQQATRADVAASQWTLSAGDGGTAMGTNRWTIALRTSASSGSPLILPHRSGGGMIDLSGNFRG